jgi:hypothetical protein
VFPGQWSLSVDGQVVSQLDMMIVIFRTMCPPASL